MKEIWHSDTTQEQQKNRLKDLLMRARKNHLKPITKYDSRVIVDNAVQ